jgi:hypothetical protein
LSNVRRSSCSSGSAGRSRRKASGAEVGKALVAHGFFSVFRTFRSQQPAW